MLADYDLALPLLCGVATFRSYTVYTHCLTSVPTLMPDVLLAVLILT